MNPTQKRITGRAIIIKDDQVLLVERWRNGQHYFGIPGGAVEAGESSQQAAKREILEETGLHVIIKQEVITMLTDDSEHHIFLADYQGGEPALPPNAPENRAVDAHNKWIPGWQPIAKVHDLEFLYWLPIKDTLIDMLQHGFPENPKVLALH